MSKVAIASASIVLLAGGWLASPAQEPEEELFVSDVNCTFFGPKRDQFLPAAQARNRRRLSSVTVEVAAKLPVTSAAAAVLPSAPGGSRTDALQNSGNLIDRHIFAKLAAQGVAPAPPTNDFEFIRRATLDLTGRVPTPEATLAFASSTDPNKRAALVDQLLNTPQWLDKWTMWFGDLYENNSFNDLAANRFIQGVVAFNNYIRQSLATGKPYNQMVSEMIAATGANSYEQGELNFLVGGVMGGGPIQDVFDKQAAVVAEKFLGIAHLDCLLCHNGRGHLDSLSLWGYYTSRQQAYGMASFMSHTATLRVPVNQGQANPYYWSLANDVVIGRQNYTLDYQLNTQTGNRPARGPANSQERVRPAYIFTGEAPRAGEPYRTALARMLTSDFQFARATVNYLWEYFFGIGLVSPSNQFDPFRLDPANPPRDCPLDVNPCGLQASHPELLNELAQRFIDTGYDLKALMRLIVNSRAYQLSSRYDGVWNPSWDRLFARKLVRRLWAEEIADAIVQTSGIPITYQNGTNWGPFNWAMQIPEPLQGAGAATNLLNAFLRGNRDDQPRSGDGSIAQALALMNDGFVMSRLTTTGTSLLARLLPRSNDELVNTLYLTVLSRFPTAEERSVALANLSPPNNRTQEAQNLLWSLYNKVDFIFNY